MRALDRSRLIQALAVGAAAGSLLWCGKTVLLPDPRLADAAATLTQVRIPTLPAPDGSARADMRSMPLFVDPVVVQNLLPGVQAGPQAVPLQLKGIARTPRGVAALVMIDGEAQWLRPGRPVSGITLTTVLRDAVKLLTPSGEVILDLYPDATSSEGSTDRPALPTSGPLPVAPTVSSPPPQALPAQSPQLGVGRQ